MPRVEYPGDYSYGHWHMIEVATLDVAKMFRGVIENWGISFFEDAAAIAVMLATADERQLTGREAARVSRNLDYRANRERKAIEEEGKEGMEVPTHESFYAQLEPDQTTQPNESVAGMSPLRKARERSGMTATTVAAAIGATQSHYSKIENCKVIPSPELADRIAKHFGNAVTRDQILFPHDYTAPDAKAS